LEFIILFNAISDQLMMNSNDSSLLLLRFYQFWIIIITIILYDNGFKNAFAAEEFISKSQFYTKKNFLFQRIFFIQYK
jgi:hypothetical protein